MDSENLKRQIDSLNVQIFIASKINRSKQRTMLVEDIINLDEIKNYDEETKKNALKIMVSRGILNYKFIGGEIAYEISDFGDYFFAELCKTNSGFNDMYKR